MAQRKHFLTIIFFLFVLLFKAFAQDSPAKIINDAYFECFGRIATDDEISSGVAYVKTHNVAVKDLIAEQTRYIKEHPDVQKEIIRKAYADAYGISSQTKTDSCFNTKTNKPEEVFTYQALINNLKNCLDKNIKTLQFSVIQRSYNDYFGVPVNREDKNVKTCIDSATSNHGILYKTLMEQHRLYIIKTPEEQKAVINRAFNAVFGRDPKIAEMDGWFNNFKYDGCSYTVLLKQYNEYKKVHPKPVSPILPTPGTATVVYIRAGTGTNESCNCTGEKIYLVNADEINSYKAIVSFYSYKSNTTTTAEYIIAPKQVKFIDCTKDIECLYSWLYSVVRYTKK